MQAQSAEKLELAVAISIPIGREKRNGGRKEI